MGKVKQKQRQLQQQHRHGRSSSKMMRGQKKGDLISQISKKDQITKIGEKVDPCDPPPPCNLPLEDAISMAIETSVNISEECQSIINFLSTGDNNHCITGLK